MKKLGVRALCILWLSIIYIEGKSQSYRIDYVIDDPNYLSYCSALGDLCEYRGVTMFFELASGSGVWAGEGTYVSNYIIVPSKPIRVTYRERYVYEEYGIELTVCDQTTPVNLTYGSCYSTSTTYGSTCDFADISFTITPVLTLTGSSGGDYCENETLTLNNTSGFTPVQWQYRVDAGIWQNFDPGLGNSVAFGIENIFGGSYTTYLHEGLSFRYTYSEGGCNPNTDISNILQTYTFSPARPEVSTSSVASPSCKDGIDAVIKINSISRNILSGETLTYDIYTLGDVWMAQKSSSQQPTVENPIEIRGDNDQDAPFGIASGDYKILVQSNLSLCGAVTYYPLPTIINPTQVTFTSTSTQPLCYGGGNGSITINASGGKGTGYEYSKDNGANYQTNNVLSGLSFGSYDVIVKDGNGCTSAMTSISISQPDDINISSVAVTSNYNGSDISCVNNADGQITVTASGGTGGLVYSRDGSTFQASNVFTGLGENNYTFTVRDGNSCTKSSTPVAVVAPSPIAASLTPTAATCNGSSDGTIDVVSPSGGTGSLTFSIDNGANYQTSLSFTNLPANAYTVTVRDINLCTSTFNTTVNQPLAIGVTATPTLVTCAGGSDGSVEITASNAVGTPTYSFNGGAFVASNVFTGLAANTYPLSVRDANGCIGTGSVTINSNPIITGPIAVANTISCNGASDGALNLSPGGGVAPYTFLWSTGATSEDISALAAATYSVTITDSENCQQSFNRVLAQPLPVAVTYFTSDFNGSAVSCFGSSDGSIDISSSGGNGGYTYAWSNGAVTEDIGGLIAGTYSVTVTDAKSCIGNQTIIISQPDQLVSTINSTENIACFGGNTGSIVLTTTGGTTDYEYSIDGGVNWQSSSTFTNLGATAYTLLTRDANGCSDSDGTTLTSPTDIILTIDDVVNTTCNQNNGGASASATGGVSNYTFNWFNSSNTQIGTGNSISNLAAGVYRIEVLDQNSCSKQQNVTISSSDGPSITVQSVTAASCSNTSDGSATISITQGESPYSILWPNNQTTETATNLAGGDYIVEVRDNTNCLALQTVTVPAPAPLIIQTITEQDPTCFGNADGEIEVLAQGGNGGYAYNWSTGATGTILINLPAGTYTLTTTDSKNCEAAEEFTLVDPPLFVFDLGEDEKICEGQTVIKQSEVDNAVYAWTGPDNFSSDQQQVSISQPGVYTLTVINQNGCEASDSFTLSFDTDLLKADFLMVSEAFAGDTIIVIDISWPVPTTVAWQFDAAAVVLDQSQDFSLIRFDEPGDYTISMLAQLATCASSYSQSISILENTDDGSGGRISSEKIIHALTIYPNPTTDKLDVTIELNKAHRAVMEIYHLHSNQKELSQIFDGNTFYESDLSLAHLQSGLYVVVLKAGKEIKSMKLIKL